MMLQILGIISVVIIGLTLVGLVLINRRKNQKSSIGQQSHSSIIAPVTTMYPSLPPEGLPPGWTIEQWAWYGEEYLRNR